VIIYLLSSFTFTFDIVFNKWFVDRSAIFSLLVVADNIIATGDDEGTLKVIVLSCLFIDFSK